MRLSLVFAACAVCGAIPSGAFGQGRQPYETPQYTPSVSAEPDKDFGLPAFGLPGALPRHETTATGKPDFFRPSPEPASPGADRSSPTDSDMDTPLFTTGDSRADQAGTATASGDYGRMETPLFTTLGRDRDATLPDNAPVAAGDGRAP